MRDHVSSHNKQIDAYTVDRRLKHHELKLLDLLDDRCGKMSEPYECLDIGCADGLFMRSLKARFASWHIEGLEMSHKLIEQGMVENAASGISIHQGDAYRFAPAKTYDLIIASGILAVFDDPLPVLDRWINWLNPGGVLFVFSTFNTGDIDTRISFRNNFAPNGWETGLTGYSTHSIRRHLEGQDVSVEFLPFELPVDLAKEENPIRSYTVLTENGKRLVIAGNIVCEFHYLIVTKPS